MSELSTIIKQICDEKGLSLEAVVGTIESALAAAYRKDFGEKNQNIKVEFDIETAKSKVFDVKEVVEDMPLEEGGVEGEEGGEDVKLKKDEKTEKSKVKSQKSKVKEEEDVKEKKAEDEKKSVEGGEDEEEERKFNPRTEIQISEAKKIKKIAKVGDEIKTKLDAPGEFGRMAAQTAKQVIIQRLREAERDMVFSEFKNKEKEVLGGVVQRREGRVVLIDLGKAVGVLPGDEQIFNEQYKPGARIKVYVKEVKIGSRGPEIILSRTADEILKKVFYLEIPEISNGLVELKSVAREAGARSKVAVAAVSENIDPIGACVGQRGARIQTIISELGGEKVDIIQYDEDPEKFIANALSPAKIITIETNEKERSATVKVNPDQLSLAIGKGGQNVRLAARLTGWRIDIVENAPEPLISAEKISEPLVGTESADDTEVDSNDDSEKQKEDKKKDKKAKKEKREEKKDEKDGGEDEKVEKKNKKEKKDDAKK